jgi:aminoglycoside phosphotransferase (APT) family kinase protein
VSRPEIERIRVALEPMLGQLRSIDELAAGTTGTTYLVETAAGRFAAKAFAADSLALLSPAQQFEVLETLVELGISPRPAGFDSEARLLVTEYLAEAAAVGPESLRRGERLADVVATLRLLHGVTVSIPRFDPVADVDRYVAATGGLGALSADDRACFDELVGLAGSIESEAICLCHNDLVASNLLFDRGLRLIDFDYAVLGPPVIDLASLAVMNELSDRQAGELLAAYYEGSSPLSVGEFARVRRLVRLTAHFWALASTAASRSGGAGATPRRGDAGAASAAGAGEAVGDAGAAIVDQYRIQHD